VVNIKSNVPKKMATATEIPIMIRVFLIVSSLVGQLTFFISNLTSFRKVAILVNIFSPKLFYPVRNSKAIG